MGSDYKDLIVWQKSIGLATRIYQFSNTFPASERFGLTNQLRRSVVSIASNVAEGQGRLTPADFARFLRIANGSRQEAETQLIIARELGYANRESVDRLIEDFDEIGRLLFGLLRSLNS